MACIEGGKMKPFPSTLVRPKRPVKIQDSEFSSIATVRFLRMEKSQWLFAIRAESGTIKAASQSLMLCSTEAIN